MIQARRKINKTTMNNLDIPAYEVTYCSLSLMSLHVSVAICIICIIQELCNMIEVFFGDDYAKYFVSKDVINCSNAISKE